MSDLQNIPPTKFETVPPNEEAEIQEILKLTVELMRQRYEGTKPLRNVHPKEHGCVKATFTINGRIPVPYQQGIFANPGKTYE